MVFEGTQRSFPNTGHRFLAGKIHLYFLLYNFSQSNSRAFTSNTVLHAWLKCFQLKRKKKKTRKSKILQKCVCGGRFIRYVYYISIQLLLFLSICVVGKGREWINMTEYRILLILEGIPKSVGNGKLMLNEGSFSCGK